jgi:hypothetical protein
MRLAPNMPHIGSGMAINSPATGPQLIINPTQMNTKGDDVTFEYKVSGKPLEEHFQVAGKTYTLSAGRLFLADLSVDPIRIVQINRDLSALIKDPNEKLTRAEWDTVIQELAKQQELREYLPLGQKSK